MTKVRGIRGATTIDKDTAEELVEATTELLVQMQASNGLVPDDVASVLFTVTPDIRSAFPATAARNLGWNMVPLLCFQEIEVSGSVARCIRILILWNTECEQEEIKHIYLKNAVNLRRDLQNKQ